MEIAGIDKRTELDPTQTLRPVSEIVSLRRAPGAVSSSGIPIKEADDDYARWLEASMPRSRPETGKGRLRSGRTCARPKGWRRKPVHRVEVTEALKRLASAGRSPG